MEPEHYHPDDLRPRAFWADFKRGVRRVRSAVCGEPSCVTGYLHALDDVYDSLDEWNPCHDRVRQWIRARRAEISPGHTLSWDGATGGKEQS